ncbi:MAG TPA: MFS transporter [Candidatus Saccharimonadales bacterium]|nr:MFS transporter [Candidatus Saccharimonadales bacterium]
MLKNQNRNLLIIALIALVNMLGYGIIIPILYSYSKRFGLSDFQNGLLFSMFSVCQFISTPIIGRLSDKYGRRPLLIISIAGTAASFFLTAFAPNAAFIFIARALDGLTAGNIPVAFAVISDSTKPEERAKAFGLIGAAFNFGFVFGPAIAALTVGLGQGVPFIIAGIITVIAVILTALYLPETNKHMGETKHGKLFDFSQLWHTLFDPNVGVTFIISLIFFLAFSCAILYGFQPFTMNILKVTPSQNALLFTMFGIIGLISQTFLVGRVSKTLGMKKSFTISLIFTALSFVIMFLSHSLLVFVIASLILGVFNSIVQTLLPTILSQEADAKSQGSIMGLNASYQSIGMIFGPILGGFVATIAIPWTFLVGAGLIVVCFFLSFRVLRPGIRKESAF